MNSNQQTKIERFLRIELNLQLDNLLFELRRSVHEGRSPSSADLILIASRLERLKNSGCEVLDALEKDPARTAFDLRSRLEVLERSA